MINTALKTPSITLVSESSKLSSSTIIINLFIQYSQIHHIVPGLSGLRLPAILTILLTLQLFLSGTIIFSKSQTKLYILLLMVMALHIPMALNNYWAMNAARSMFEYFILYMAIITFIDTPKKFNHLVFSFLAAHLFLAGYATMNSGFVRGYFGFLGDENDFALSLNIALPFAFFLSLDQRTTRFFYLPSTILLIYAIMATLSRGGFIGLIAVGLYSWLKAPLRSKILATALIALLAIFMASYGPESYWQEIATIGEEGTSEGTGGERMFHWKIGWLMFLDNPIFGVGQGNLPWEFRKYEVEAGFEEGFKGRSRAGRAAHSLYFTLLPELGLVGVLIFLGMLFSSIKDLKLVRRTTISQSSQVRLDDAPRILYMTCALEASLLAYLVTGTFISVLYYPHFWILLAFIVSLRKISTEIS